MSRSSSEISEDYEEYMPCSQCKKEFEWNGKDEGELIRVRGGGMWCKKCLEVK